MSPTKYATKWIILWMALLLLAAPGQAFSSVERDDGNVSSGTDLQKRGGADFVLASRGGVDDRRKLRRTHTRKVRQPTRTNRRGNVESTTTLRDRENTNRTRTESKRAQAPGSEFNRDSSRFERQPRVQDYEFFTPSSREPEWQGK